MFVCLACRTRQLLTLFGRRSTWTICQGELIVYNIGNLSPIYEASDKQPFDMSNGNVSDRIQIPSKTTHKDTGTQANPSYYFIN